MPTTPCVLAVVPEASDFAFLAAELQSAGIAVSRAVNLLDAVLRQADSPSSAIVCDADCLDWSEVLDVFHRLKAPSAVIFLTRLADEHLWLKMLGAGAFDLLQKPHRSGELRRAVSAALKRRSGLGATAAA